MDPKQALEQLKELDGVPTDVIEALEGSSLRQRINELETRWREEAEPAISFKQSQDTLPKRKDALKKAGVDYDAQKPFGKEVLDAIPADKLEDAEFVAEFVQAKGFEATVAQEEQGAKPGAQQIVEGTTGAGVGAPSSESYEAAVAAATTPEELDAVYAKHGKPAAVT